MASALRKLLRSQSISRCEKSDPEKQVNDVPRPAYHHAARRLFSRVCRSVHHAAKVSPAACAPPQPPTTTTSGTSTIDVNVDSSTNDEEKSPAPVLHLMKTKCLTSSVEVMAAGSSGSSKKRTSTTPMSESCINHGRLVRTRRLMREYQDLCRRQRDLKHFSVELVNDNLYEWNVKLLKVDLDSDLYRDMRETNTSCIVLNLSFPDNFPFAPPFMRVISPKIEKGFVMEGGAICMELLTPGGWASAYTIEAIIMQFSASLIKGQGRIVRKTKGGKDFNRKAAEASFRSLVKTHEKYGWVTPPLADG